MTVKILELLGLAKSFSNFSDFEFLTGVSTLVILGRGSWSELGLTQLAGIGKATPGLRGLSGPAGGADFFGFACQNRDFLTVL